MEWINYKSHHLSNRNKPNEQPTKQTNKQAEGVKAFVFEMAIDENLASTLLSLVKQTVQSLKHNSKVLYLTHFNSDLLINWLQNFDLVNFAKMREKKIEISKSFIIISPSRSHFCFWKEL